MKKSIFRLEIRRMKFATIFMQFDVRFIIIFSHLISCLVNQGRTSTIFLGGLSPFKKFKFWLENYWEISKVFCLQTNLNLIF